MPLDSNPLSHLRARARLWLATLLWLLPLTAHAQSNWPAIFYVPHQDDEALGMAASIREHVDAGRPVWVVLASDGYNEGLLNWMNGDVPCTSASQCTVQPGGTAACSIPTGSSSGSCSCSSDSDCADTCDTTTHLCRTRCPIASAHYPGNNQSVNSCLTRSWTGNTSRSGSTVTVNTSLPHLLHVGDTLSMYAPDGAVDPNFAAFSTSKTVTAVTSSKSFTYTDSGSSTVSTKDLYYFSNARCTNAGESCNTYWGQCMKSCTSSSDCSAIPEGVCIAGNCEVHHKQHLTMSHIMWARKIEFVRSVHSLDDDARSRHIPGIERIYILNNGEGLTDNGISCDGDLGIQTKSTPYGGHADKLLAFAQQLDRAAAARGANASHKFVSGYYDDGVSGELNPTHKLLWNVGSALYKSSCTSSTTPPLCGTSNSGDCCNSDVRFYRVYHQFKPNTGTCGHDYQDCTGGSATASCGAPSPSVHPTTVASPPGTATTRQDWKNLSIRQYHVWDPANGRYALGYHSVPDMLDHAAASTSEYSDPPCTSCTGAGFRD